MEFGTLGIVGMILIFLFYIVLIGLSITSIIFMIIVMIKANKALAIWIRKNDDTAMQPPMPYAPITPPVQTNFTPHE